MIHAESKLQQSCIKWFDLQYPKLKQLLFAIPNGGKRNIITAKIMQSEGVRAGVSDLCLAIPKKQYHGMFLEMKSGKNKLTEKQEKFIEQVRELGYKAEVVNSFDKFKSEIELYLTETEKPRITFQERINQLAKERGITLTKES